MQKKSSKEERKETKEGSYMEREYSASAFPRVFSFALLRTLASIIKHGVDTPFFQSELLDEIS